MSNDVSFGRWLKQHRKELGLGMEELADLIGCSPVTVKKIENGERRASRQIALLLAEQFHIPQDEREAFVTFARATNTEYRVPNTEYEAGGEEHSVLVQAPWRTAHVHRTNLPNVLTALIGRGREAEEARSLLLQPKVRLLTLTGAPGIGKTRLALQVASDVAEHFEDGVYLVELAPVGEPGRVPATAARAVGLKEEHGVPVEEALVEYLRERQMLLVFDNFEHLLDAAPAVVKLLEAGHGLKVLATSREALHVRGERRYPVSPLELPDLDHLPHLEELAAYPSVELSVERAQAAAPDFVLSKANSYDVAAVCARLEGLPLAIELAAARADSLQPREMRAALDSRLKLLTLGARDLPARQRTLRSAIEWSYDLLDEDERRLFRRLGVFVGGFTAAAAEEVCRSESSAHLSPLISSLADKNLIRAERPGGALRYSMLETIREYASERLLDSGEVETLDRAHALYFMRVAEEAKATLISTNDPGPLNRLGEDNDNVRSALHWTRYSAWTGRRESHGDRQARATQAAEIGLRLGAAIWPYWYSHGYINEGRAELASILAAPATLSGRHRADALNGAGVLAYEQGDTAAARSFYEDSLAIKREIGDTVGVASTLNNLGILAHEEGDHATARSYYKEGLAVSREIGDRLGVAKMLNNLAELVYDQGDYDYARALNEESLAMKREFGDKMGIANSLSNLGTLAHAAGDHATARRLHEESLDIRREVGDNRGVATSLNNLGLVAYDQGDYAGALRLHREALGMRWEMGGKLLVLDSLLGLGRLAARAGEAHRGATLLGAAGALWKTMRLTPTADMRTIEEQGVVSTRAQLDEDAFARAWAEGEAMDMASAVMYALGREGEGS